MIKKIRKALGLDKAQVCPMHTEWALIDSYRKTSCCGATVWVCSTYSCKYETVQHKKHQ